MGAGKRLPVIGMWVLGLVAAAGCLPMENRSDFDAPPASAALCAAGWQEMYRIGVQSGYQEPLLWHDGTLYFSVREPAPKILALSAAGGEPREVAADMFERAWIEGDRLIYGKVSDRLLGVSLAGGTPEVVFDGGSVLSPPSYLLATDVLLGADYVYWDLTPQRAPADWTLWRGSRATGVIEQIASAPATSTLWRMRGVPDAPAVVAFDADQAPYWIPLDGGTPRALAHPVTRSPDIQELIGVSATGILWSRLNSSYDDPGEVLISDVASSPGRVRSLWANKPATTIAWGGSPVRADGAGGWTIAVAETFPGERANGPAHASVWAIDAAGHGRRLGCSPQTSAFLTPAATLAPDAIYGIAATASTESSYFDYSVVRIPR